MTVTANEVSLDELIERVVQAGRGTSEVAVLDVGEPADLVERGTLFAATNLPLAHLRARISELVPRRATPVVVLDGYPTRNGAASQAAMLLGELGYSDVAKLSSPVSEWPDRGVAVVHGPHAVGQAFGEFVLDQFATPTIGLGEFDALLNGDRPVVLLDARPEPEHVAWRVPGGIAAPGASIVERARGAIVDDNTVVVVTCAGRTRSILGAQTLIDERIGAELGAEIVALSGGLGAWLLDGRHEDSGTTDLEFGGGGAAVAQRAATIDPAQVARAQRRDDRTTVVFDVRPPHRYANGHLRGSRNLPSWELVPWIGRHFATRGAQIVLADDGALETATVTARWLQRSGWGSVEVVDVGVANESLIDAGAPHEQAPLAAVRSALSPWDYSGAERLAQLRAADGFAEALYGSLRGDPTVAFVASALSIDPPGVCRR